MKLNLAALALLLVTLGQARHHKGKKLSHETWSIVQDYLTEDIINDVVDTVKDFVEDNQDAINDVVDTVVDIIDDSTEIYENGVLFYDYLDAIGGGPGCAIHCRKQAQACAADQICRENMGCVAENCDISNSTCTFICTESYQTPKIDDLMSCMFVDYECVQLPPPDDINNATCRDPTDYLTDYDKDMLNGDWYTIQGFNPLYDCFDCAIQTYDIADDGSAEYDALFNMLDVNGNEIWPLKTMFGENTATPGVLSLDGSENGLPDHQNWYLMHLSEDTAIAYYCGTVLTWKFEGLLVMSRTTELNPEREADVAAVLADLEIDAADMCYLEPATSCSDAPREFIM